MIPNHLFDSAQSDKLKRFFAEKVYQRPASAAGYYV